jgi:hypothetical protein
MAVWLIAKAFKPGAILAEHAGRTSEPRAAASGGWRWRRPQPCDRGSRFAPSLRGSGRIDDMLVDRIWTKPCQETAPLQSRGGPGMHTCKKQSDPVVVQLVIELGEHVERGDVQLSGHLEVEHDRLGRHIRLGDGVADRCPQGLGVRKKEWLIGAQDEDARRRSMIGMADDRCVI